MDLYRLAATSLQGMCMNKLTHLTQIAEAATPGPWWVEHYAERDSAIVCGTPGDPSDTFDLMERYNVETDYKFIAAFNPAIVLKLLASLREMGEALETYQGLIESGWLGRDTSKDNDHNWALKQLEPIGKLQGAAMALTAHRERWKG